MKRSIREPYGSRGHDCRLHVICGSQFAYFRCRGLSFVPKLHIQSSQILPIYKNE